MVWCAEFDDAPSMVIEQRFPGVPNVRDVKRIPWWIMAPIDVLTAGYPCQPFSLAGARKGEDDERHLWPSIAEGIQVMRPRHVLLENVRGHLSLGFDQVLHDLDGMGYAVAWRILSASAVGACHRRERLFIYAQPVEHAAPASGRVLAVAGADGWLEADEDLFGDRLPWTEKLPTAGVMRDGAIRSVTLPQAVAEGALFPTPDASAANDGEGIETWRARRERVKARGINGNGMGMPLAIAVQELPTPTASDHTGSGGNHASHVTLTDAVIRTEFGTKQNERHLLPTPEAKLATSGPDYARQGRDQSGGHDLTTAVALLPTPYAYEGARGGVQDPEKRREGGHSVALSDVVAFDLLPTPSAAIATGGQRSRSGDRQDELLLGGIAIEAQRVAQWGKYEAAVERHALMLGRTPAAPTQPNTKGNPELAPRFVEWMMCLAEGWVTDIDYGDHLTARKTREAILRILGNGVVPPQALAAYRTLLAVSQTQPHDTAALAAEGQLGADAESREAVSAA